MFGQTQPLQILMIEDDLYFQEEVKRHLIHEFRVNHANSIAEAQKLIHQYHFDVVLLDKILQEEITLSLITEIKDLYPECAILLLTADSNFNSAKEALELGACDYIVKPHSLIPSKNELKHSFFDHLIHRIHAAKNHLSILLQNIILKERIEQNKQTELIGRSKTILEIKDKIKKVKDLNTPILILGETGTGKELIAKLLHEQEKSGRPFEVINCAAISQNLIESHLFGHEKGAFTGATNPMVGYFEKANGGDLFLDEVGDIPYDIQVKLLRVLDSGVYTRVGSVLSRRTNVRLICATHRNLEKLIHEQKFRSDFYFRINGIQIKTAPLRAHNEDIEDLAHYFLLKNVGVHYSVPKETIEFLRKQPWPGNVRELRNAIELAYANARSKQRSILQQEDFELSLSSHAYDHETKIIPLPSTIEDLSPKNFFEFTKSMEHLYLEKTLQLCGYNLVLVQLHLGVSRTTLYQKIKEHEITIKQQKIKPLIKYRKFLKKTHQTTSKILHKQRALNK